MTGQINIGGEPYSFINPGRSVKSVNAISLPAIDEEKLYAEDAQDAENGLPSRFGFPHKVNLTLENSGSWQVLSNGDRLWTLDLYCPKAKSINLLYDKFWLPKGATFYIYSSDHSHVIGGFTEKNNKGPRTNPAKFATGLVYGDKVTLEYYEPSSVKGTGILSISQVVHGYKYINITKSLRESLENKTGFGLSGECQVNVNCPEGDNWRDQISSVALILVMGTHQCTGCLVNNVRGDKTPYFLTANHCLNTGSVYDAIENPDAGDWTFYWHYQSSDCLNNGADFIPPSTSGAIVVANSKYPMGSGNYLYTSDFALLRLTESPSELLNQPKVYYSGWERNPPGKGGVGIHHPSGDIKKIATYDVTPTSSGRYWKVTKWAATNNGHSVPEGGSSGSPLFNNQKRIVGQLWGSKPLRGCPVPLENSSKYGKISVSWDFEPDRRRRLKDWLDPDNTNTMTLDGSYLSSSSCNIGLYNQNFSSNKTITGCKVSIGNVIVGNNADLIIQASDKTVINGTLEVKLGSTFKIK